VSLLSVLVFVYQVAAPYERQWGFPPAIEAEETLEIKIMTEARDAGINPQVALAIAFCESGLDPLIDNKYSSASGLFQFIDGTWENYCEGDVYDEDDNIACFMKWYPTKPHWWLCHTKLYG